jgi:hypothetical protein
MRPNLFFFIILFILVSFTGVWAIPYTWNGSTNTNWNVATNWTPNGIPDVGDDVTISIAAPALVLDNNRTIQSLTLTAANTLNLGGFQLTITSTINVTNGNIQNGTVFSSLLTSFSWQNTVTSATINVRSNNWGGGSNNTFNGPVTLIHAGTTNSSFGSNNTVNGRFTFSTENNRFRLDPNGGSVYNGDSLIFINLSAVNESIFMSQLGTNVINCPIRVASTSTGDTRLGANAGGSLGSVSFGIGVTISTSGFVSGHLYLQNCRQTGATPLNIVLPSTASVTLSDSCLFLGNVVIEGRAYNSDRCRYIGTASFTKNGATSENLGGGNYFSGSVTIVNNGSGDSNWGSTRADTFASNVTITNAGTGGADIRIAQNNAGNFIGGNVTITNNSASLVTLGENASSTLLINGNVEINSLSGNGISIGAGGGVCTLPANFFIGVGGFLSGSLIIRNTTFTGLLPISISMDPGAGQFITSGSNYLRTLTVVASGVNVASSIFQANASFHKTGGGNNTSAGGNYFSGNLDLILSGSNALTFGLTTADTVMGNLTMINLAGSTITFANNSLNNFINGSLLLRNSSSGSCFVTNGVNASTFIQGIVSLENTGTGTIGFANGGGSTFLSSSSTLQLTATGISSGTLLLRNITQSSTTAINLPATGGTISFNNAQFGGIFFSTAGGYAMTGSRFLSDASIIKTGPGNNNLVGGNRFYGNLTTGITGPNYILYGNTFPDTVDGNLTLTNSGTERAIFAHNTPNNVVGGNVNIQNIGSGNVWLANNPSAICRIGGSILIENNGGTGVSIGTGGGQTSLANGDIQLTGAGFTSGTLDVRNLIQVSSLASNLLTLTGGVANFLNNDFAGLVQLSAPRLTVSNSIFRQNASLTKTGATQDVMAGGNRFLGNLVAGITANGNLIFGNTIPDTIVGDLTLNNAGSAILIFANTSANNLIGGNLNISNTGSGSISISNNAASSLSINGNVLIENTGGAAVRFGENAGTITLASGRNISLLGAGFSGGILQFRNFTQQGTASSSLSTTGVASIEIRGSNFGGPLTTTSANITFQESTFAEATFTKTAGVNQTLFGGNSFSSNLSFTNLSNTTYVLANNQPDTYGGNVVLTNSGTGQIRLAENTSVNTIAGNLTLNNQSTGQVYVGNGILAQATVAGDIFLTNSGGGGVFLSNGNGATLTCAGILEINSPNGGTVNLGNATGNTTFTSPTASISIGAGGFNNSATNWNRVIKTSPNATSLITTGTSTITINNSSLTGNFTSSSNSVVIQTNRFLGDVSITKTGTVDNVCTGRNFISGNASFTVAGPNYLMMGNGNADTIQGNMQVNLSGAGAFYYARAGANHRIDGNVSVNSTGTGIVYFSEQASATLRIGGNITLECIACSGVRFTPGFTTQSAGAAILTGAGGINAGSFNFRNFTQLGSAANTLFATGTAITDFYSCTFGGNFDITAPRILLRESTFSGTTSFTRSSTTNDDNFGGNTFTGQAIMTNNGVGARWLFGNALPDAFSSDATFINTNTGSIRVAWNVAGTTIAGLTTLRNTGTGSIFLTENAGTATLSGNLVLENPNGGTINIGNNGTATTIQSGGSVSIGGLGFNNGTLSIRALTLNGTGTTNLLSTGNTTTTLNGCTFGGDLNVTSGQWSIRETSVSGNSVFTKTQPGNNTSVGGNTFGGNVTIIHNNANAITWGDGATLPDTFNGNVTIQNNSTGSIELARNNTTSFRGNIGYSSPNAILFASVNGAIVFSGSANQTITDLSGTTPIPAFRRVTLNKPTGALVLNTSVDFGVSVAMTSGIIETSLTNMLRFQNATTLTGGSTISHVSGPMIKIGNQAFDFPVGKGGVYAPISISAAGVTTDQFRAEYFNVSPNSLYPNANRVPSIDRTSGCEYWNLDRIVGTTGRFVSLSWEDPRTCGVNDFSLLLVARWNGTQWVNEGGANFTGNNTTGTLRSTGSITAFSPFTLASSTGFNPLPITGISLSATPSLRAVHLQWKPEGTYGEVTFEVQRASSNGAFAKIYEESVSGNSQSRMEQFEYHDLQPPSGNVYYRVIAHEGDRKTWSNNAFVYLEPSLISVYPTVLGEGDPVTVYAELDDAEAEISLQSIKGEESATLKTGLEAGEQKLSLGQVVPGVYFLSIYSPLTGTFRRTKIVIQ